MIKVFYVGRGIYKRLTSDCIGTPMVEPLHGENYLLFDHDIETLNLIGSVSIKALLDADLEKTIVYLTDKDGNPDAFQIVKGQDIYTHDNGNALRLYFDDIAPVEKPLNETERNTMLKLIYGMAIEGYGYDPKAERNEATGSNKISISSKLALLGRDFEISDATVRKYLNEAKKQCTPKN